MLTLEQINTVLAKEKLDLEFMLKKAEDNVISGRDIGIPVYLTRYRIKSPESIYLKMRRRNTSNIWELTDIAGLRVLCLFDDDVEHVYNYLLEQAFTGYRIKRIKYFNVPIRSYTQLKVRSYLHPYFDDGLTPDDLLYTKKASGYLSIHFILQPKDGPKHALEVQLRTLLQDVWGELEHSLAYKHAGVNCEIRNAFRRLQRDLSSMGARLSELNKISREDRVVDRFVAQPAPFRYLEYDDNLLPPVFREPEISSRLRGYQEIFYRARPAVDTEGFCAQARLMRDELAKAVDAAARGDDRLRYWKDMEEAYVCFCEGDLQEAAAIYEDVIARRVTDAYVPHFRRGEIHFLNGDIVRAVGEFEKADDIVTRLLVSRPPDKHTLVNAYRIKVKMAYSYWMCGEDYIDIALDRNEEASGLFERIGEQYTGSEDPFAFDAEGEKLGMLNNRCWYRLEKFRRAYREGDEKIDKLDTLYKAALAAFEELEPSLKDENITSNALDTAAWFCLCRFRMTLEQSALEKAIGYGRRMIRHRNRASATALVAQVHSEHLREIAASAEALGLWSFGKGSR